MSTDKVTNDNTGSTSPLPDVTDNSCRLQVTDIIPLTVAQCDSGNLCFEVKPEILTAVKQEPDDWCGLQFTDVFPVTTDDDHFSSAVCDNGDLCFQVEAEISSAVKQEPHALQVCCTVMHKSQIISHSQIANPIFQSASASVPRVSSKLSE